MQKKELRRRCLNCWCAVMKVFYRCQDQGMTGNELVKLSLEDGNELMHLETHECETRPSPQRASASLGHPDGKGRSRLGCCLLRNGRRRGDSIRPFQGSDAREEDAFSIGGLGSCIKNRFPIPEMSRMGARMDSRAIRMVGIVSGGRLSFAPCTLSPGSRNVIRWAPCRVSLASLSWTFHQTYPLDLRFRLPSLANSCWAMATLRNFGMPSGGPSPAHETEAGRRRLGNAKR